MDSEHKPSKDIVNALEKMDQEAAERQVIKNREIKRRKKQTPVVEEIDRQEVIKKQNIEDQNKLFNKIKKNGLILTLIFVATLMLTYSLSREERTSAIENVIFLFLICGIIAAKSFKI